MLWPSHTSRGLEPRPPYDWAWACQCGWISEEHPAIGGARAAFIAHADSETCIRMLGDLRCGRDREHAGGCVFLASSQEASE